MTFDRFAEIWAIDFEFHAPAGERQTPICMVATEHRSGRTIRLWFAGGAPVLPPPFIGRDDALVVTFFGSAEFGCYHALGWPQPKHVVDLFAEFRNTTNGLMTPCGNSLLGALTYFGRSSLDATKKDRMRELAMRGGPYSTEERGGLLAYCESDVQHTRALFSILQPRISLDHALLRGWYMWAVAAMEWNGTPLDVDTLTAMRTAWPFVRSSLIDRVSLARELYDGTTFKLERFERLLKRLGIPWPRTSSGRLALGDETFRQMARAYPVIAPIRELRHALSDLRLEDLTVGRDGRGRCLLSPYRSITGRNQPSTTKFIFGNSCWLRGLIKPARNRALAYLDYAGQENGIAAYLSGDAKMMADYGSGDPYLGFAKRVGIVPPDATKSSHGAIRDRLKIALGLGAMYGAGPESIAGTTGFSVAQSRDLLRLHRETYRDFWSWSQAAVDHAILHGHLHTCFGWFVHVGADTNHRGLSNFPMQANAAEMLRLACCFAVESGVTVCAPVHDALLIEAEIDEIETAVQITQNAMHEASRIVLDGHELRTDVKIIRWPDRYMDGRGVEMWNTVMSIMDELALGEITHAARTDAYV